MGFFWNLFVAWRTVGAAGNLKCRVFSGLFPGSGGRETEPGGHKTELGLHRLHDTRFCIRLRRSSMITRVCDILEGSKKTGKGSF